MCRLFIIFLSNDLIFIFYIKSFYVLFFFFFQAEDGIRDYKVTGVQTCALPILPGSTTGPSTSMAPWCTWQVTCARSAGARPWSCMTCSSASAAGCVWRQERSGERRGGEEGRSRGWPDH